ncbi:NAD-P-binding protein [Gloeopeniophorella convolvens]|nr:NAD-P-binding protein [Gloeopeniophorella convolvens]
MIGNNEVLPVTRHHDVYPTIDPRDAFTNKTYRGKVVLITGASRGIGLETAITYAQAGASVTIAARLQETLDKSAAAIQEAAPDAQVLAVPTDVRDPKATEAAVKATLRRFGRLDVLVANAGALSGFLEPMGTSDPDRWWNTFEVNVRGVYNIVRASLPALQEASGRIVVVSSGGAQLRFPNSSDYCTSKHTVGRLVEFIALENPKLKVFTLDPGTHPTQMAYETGIEFTTEDTLQLPAAAMLYLTSGKADWLSGRYVSSTWDLEEVERDWKEKILSGHELVSKLSIPK